MNETITKILKQFRLKSKITSEENTIAEYYKTLHEIKKLETKYKNKSDSQLREESKNLINQAKQVNSLDELLIEAYALINETIQRVLIIKPFDVQIIGGIVLHQGKLAEMQTGEGKTLTAVFPAYLNALTGKGVHILTFNDYLAYRDAEWMGPIHQFLGLDVGHIQEGMCPEERKCAYSAEITYLTAKEAGFDYLRDYLCYKKKNIVHCNFNFAIIDEADSILIDEARIPLILAGSSDETISDSYKMANFARKLEQNIDFEYDEYSRNFNLTDDGLKRVESLLYCGNLHDQQNIELLTSLNCAIHAEFLLQRDVDYIVRENKIEIVDEFTGRVADRRRWPDGLQAALEAKENINIQKKGNILNSITLQHFLQSYPKICGMTATALPAAEEFKNFYGLEIVTIPSNKPCIRTDHKDVLFKTKIEKEKAIIEAIVIKHKTNQPILVGTASVEESTKLAKTLHEKSVNCEVLNAKRDEFEAQIVSEAGKLGAVTISTNMAGRGTDIRLGGSDEIEKQKVVDLGGLYVIGTNKHESQRIDKQLRGRAGRQGDPGSSCFFISLDDNLFVKYRLQELLPKVVLEGNQKGEIDDKYVRKEVNRVQRIVEGQNLEIKKTLNRYSSIVEQQRKILFTRRNKYFRSKSALNYFKGTSPEQFEIYKSYLE